MRICTFQPLEVYTLLQNEGVVLVDPTKSDYLNDVAFNVFVNAYDWMRDQMRKRLPSYQDRYPWWGLVDPTAEDLENWNGHGYLLELNIPDSEVLVSHYDAWYSVLNDWHCPLNEMDYHAFNAKTEPFDLLPDEFRREMVESWDRIFDLDTLTKSDYWGESHRQACFEELRLEDLVSVSFVERKERKKDSDQ